jgi:toxin CcdB
MARFDLYTNAGIAKTNSPYLIDVQSDHLDGLLTRVVIPLTRMDAYYTASNLPEDLMPVFEINGAKYVLETPVLAAIPVKKLGPLIGSVREYRVQITAALDRLTGSY